jgi:hypothetical protein
MPRPRCVRPDGDQQRKAVTHRHAIGILDCGWSVQVALIAAGAALAAAAAALFAGPQAGRTPRRHRYHRLMRPPATALHACLTTGPPALDLQAGLRCPQADPASHDDRRAARALIYSLSRQHVSTGRFPMRRRRRGGAAVTELGFLDAISHAIRLGRRRQPVLSQTRSRWVRTVRTLMYSSAPI